MENSKVLELVKLMEEKVKAMQEFRVELIMVDCPPLLEMFEDIIKMPDGLEIVLGDES